MLAEWIKTLDDGGLLVDLNALPRPRRSLLGTCGLVIPKGTKGWIICACDGSTCRASEFRVEIDTAAQPLKITPAKLHCPLCSCRAGCFEFKGRTVEDARRVVKSNQMSF